MNTLPVVLLAEDDPLIAELIETSLEDAGFEVVVVPNGAAALGWLDRGLPYDALITDIRMGAGPSGWEVARHAREGTPAVPVVYMSGDSEGDWTARGVPQSLLISKPFAPAQIVTAISTLLNAPPHA